MVTAAEDPKALPDRNVVDMTAVPSSEPITRTPENDAIYRSIRARSTSSLR